MNSFGSTRTIALFVASAVWILPPGLAGAADARAPSASEIVPAKRSGGSLASGAYGQRFLEGIILSGTLDVGYTSVWASDVVLPMRAGGGVALALARTFEVSAALATFTPSVVLGSFDSWATTLGVRWSFARSPAIWTRRHLEVEPQPGDLETP